jgi:hypothetical protein
MISVSEGRYQRSCEKLQAANAMDNDFHYPLNTVIFILIYVIYYLGSIVCCPLPAKSHSPTGLTFCM